MTKVKHGYASTMKCACMDIDALNACGVYATGDMDNGVMVTLKKMAQGSDKVATGFEWEVQPALEASEDVWMVCSPEVGATLDQQELSDPRYFYNEAGRPMSIKHLLPNVDFIEVTAECFTEATLPDMRTNSVAKIGEGGKLVATTLAPEKGVYFQAVAKHSVAIGMEEVPTVILQCLVK